VKDTRSAINLGAKTLFVGGKNNAETHNPINSNLQEVEEKKAPGMSAELPGEIQWHVCY